VICTFLDTGVIIAAASGSTQEKHRAQTILADPNREFVTSPFVELEIVPHAERQGTPENIAFYREYFRTARMSSNLAEIVKLTAQELRRTNMKLADALHVAAANLAGADEFITTEKSTKAMHQNTLVKVTFFR
jgi:predicted nucleic acid-binding protein